MRNCCRGLAVFKVRLFELCVTRGVSGLSVAQGGAAADVWRPGLVLVPGLVMTDVSASVSPRAGAEGASVARSVRLRRQWRARGMSGVRGSSRAGMSTVAAAAGGVVAGSAVWGSAPAIVATGAALVAVVIVDVREGRIPTPVMHAGVVVVLCSLATVALVDGGWGRLGVAVASAGAAAGVLALGWLAGGVGFGDVRLASLVSFTAGWHGVDVVVAMWWWTAVAVFVVAVVARVGGRRSIPLAPAVALGWVVALGGVA
jgi:leader peptidase (prepilin peptidase) / N-methyltransferase